MSNIESEDFKQWDVWKNLEAPIPEAPPEKPAYDATYAATKHVNRWVNIAPNTFELLLEGGSLLRYDCGVPGQAPSVVWAPKIA